jgi:hypothetical protein
MHLVSITNFAMLLFQVQGKGKGMGKELPHDL